MMVMTHALAGMLVGALALFVEPSLAPVAALAGAAGGVFPDLDIYVGHRRTLHFPVYAAAVAVPVVALALAGPSALSVALAAFCIGAALHAASDVLGGGLELRPWEATSDRAVYSHFHGRWLAPRRWVRYDGAPEDFLVASALALPSLVLFDGLVAEAALGLLVISAGYTFLRRRLADLWHRLARMAPARLVPYVPERFHG
jgi:hypothetical protein